MHLPFNSGFFICHSRLASINTEPFLRYFATLLPEHPDTLVLPDTSLLRARCLSSVSLIIHSSCLKLQPSTFFLPSFSQNLLQESSWVCGYYYCYYTTVLSLVYRIKMHTHVSVLDFAHEEYTLIFFSGSKGILIPIKITPQLCFYISQINYSSSDKFFNYFITKINSIRAFILNTPVHDIFFSLPSFTFYFLLPDYSQQNHFSYSLI